MTAVPSNVTAQQAVLIRECKQIIRSQRRKTKRMPEERQLEIGGLATRIGLPTSDLAPLVDVNEEALRRWIKRARETDSGEHRAAGETNGIPVKAARKSGRRAGARPLVIAQYACPHCGGLIQADEGD